MQVVWLTPALHELNAIEDYIAQDNPVAAQNLIRQIRHIADLLEDQPLIGRTGRHPKTRELVIPGTPYILIYTVSAQRVLVLAVIHGARRWPDTN